MFSEGPSVPEEESYAYAIREALRNHSMTLPDRYKYTCVYVCVCVCVCVCVYTNTCMHTYISH